MRGQKNTHTDRQNKDEHGQTKHGRRRQTIHGRRWTDKKDGRRTDTDGQNTDEEEKIFKN